MRFSLLLTMSAYFQQFYRHKRKTQLKSKHVPFRKNNKKQSEQLKCKNWKFAIVLWRKFAHLLVFWQLSPRVLFCSHSNALFSVLQYFLMYFVTGSRIRCDAIFRKRTAIPHWYVKAIWNPFFLHQSNTTLRHPLLTY